MKKLSLTILPCTTLHFTGHEHVYSKDFILSKVLAEILEVPGEFRNVTPYAPDCTSLVLSWDYCFLPYTLCTRARHRVLLANVRWSRVDILARPTEELLIPCLAWREVFKTLRRSEFTLKSLKIIICVCTLAGEALQPEIILAVLMS